MRHSSFTGTPLQEMDLEQLSRHFAGAAEPDVQLIAAIRYTLENASASGLQAHPLEVAEILRELNVDRQTLITTLLVPALFTGRLTQADIQQQFGEVIARLSGNVTELVRRRFEAPAGKPEQAERLRRMLLAMVDDVRAVLIKLAFRLQNLRIASRRNTPDAVPLAQETLEVIAPLANRLGIGSLKWEMEDLSLRILEPEAYRSIARDLDADRRAREAYIDGFTRELQEALDHGRVRARVSGRPKHIYSIWKKTQRKQLSPHELTDLRATRVIVDELPTCYTVLGIVHNRWPHLPGEFDDYIAHPKDNGYQSLHTAVVGPEGKVVEVQIRTQAMHEFAELGVAAHWRYKEGGREDKALTRAINSLRQLLEADGGDAQNLLEEFQSEVLHQRVFVLTPRGEVMDLPSGATPLDFAYAVHTEVGHRCRGAKVEGRIVPLTYSLRSGQRVEILTARQGGPSRDWLNPGLGYLKTARARTKVRSWFRQQNQEEHLASGRSLLERECQRLGVTKLDPDDLATRLGYRRAEDMLIGLGAGDLTTTQVAQKLQVEAATPLPPLRVRKRTAPESGASGDIHIRGVGGLLTTLAHCCRPVPGDPIIGFITRGKGVSVHRSDCLNILRLPEDKRARLISVTWGEEAPTQAVDLVVEAQDRQGLLRDISNVFTNAEVNLIAVQTRTNPVDRSVHMDLTAEIESLSQLSALFDRIQSVPNVYSVRRRSNVGRA